MEIMSVAFLQALIAIILIDLVLAGDNAIVIGLAARKLPPNLQKKAVFWGAIGAVAVRSVLTLFVEPVDSQAAGLVVEPVSRCRPLG